MTEVVVFSRGDSVRFVAVVGSDEIQLGWNTRRRVVRRCVHSRANTRGIPFSNGKVPYPTEIIDRSSNTTNVGGINATCPTAHNRSASKIRTRIRNVSTL
ncbi:MAG: hypothetical protein OXG88_05535 [Gammaproteobacteria bacterium]|nr:hypothetical protein [Gammaproteobacteria bacterium]